MTKLSKLKNIAEQFKVRRKRCMAYAHHVQSKLNKDTPNQTNIHAEFLAYICNEFDVAFGPGSQLCLKWFLDHYIAKEFERAHPWIEQIWQFLVDNGHDCRNKLEYFNDAKAFFVDKTRHICVFGKDEPRYLVIDNRKKHTLNLLWDRCYVRRIWRRTKLDCIGGVERPTLKHYRAIDFQMRFHDGPFRIYGDCRDQGHVLTYTDQYGSAKCDHAIWDINEPLGFFFEVNSLWTQTVGELRQQAGAETAGGE